MNEENDDFIVLLHIAEGVGLDFTGEDIVITASLGGNKLETEIIKPGEITTTFNNNLIWETNKKSVKRMKTENLPIKVECFTSHIARGQEVRNLIGYILLPIRGVPMSLSRKISTIKPHWHKMIGLNTEWKKSKPELSLLLAITDRQTFVQGNIFDIKPTIAESEESVAMHPPSTAEMLRSQQGIFIKLLQEEGLLQVGNLEEDCHVFIAKITFKNARNLEHIINPEEQMNLLFRFHYSLLGTPSHCPLEPKGNGVYGIQEKIAINFRTSLASLNEYFNKVFYLPVDIYYNESIVAHAIVRLNNLLSTTDLPQFLESQCDRNIFQFDNIIPIETLFDLPPNSPQPYIEYAFNLQYMSTSKIRCCEVIHDKFHMVEYRDNQAGGDRSNLHSVELPPILDQEPNETVKELRPVQSDTILPVETEDNNDLSPKHTYSNPVIKTPQKVNMEELLNDKGSMKTAREAPRAFSFTLFLQSLKFSRRPEMGIWQISLHHPKADTPFTIANVELSEISSNMIEFKNLELQLVFASTIDEILNLVESESCVLNINGPRGMHATADIDNEILLVSTKEKHSGIILLENQNGEKVGMAHIFVSLDDLGISFNSQLKNRINAAGSPTKPFLDDGLAYKIVEELEDWKHVQQESFLVELKRKEVNHLAMLSAEWQKRKMEQETKLGEKLEECTALATALEKANNEVQEKGMNQIEQERLTQQIRTEMEEQFSGRLLEINEKARRLEDDMKHQMKLEELKYRELELSKGFIQHENKKLKNEIMELNDQITEMRKTFLPREQLAGLFQDVRILSERLEEVQKSKIFYKDQWAKIIREVHRMKAENLRQIELRLKHNRNISLDDVIENEQSELLCEKKELSVIQEALESDGDIIDQDDFYHHCRTIAPEVCK